MSKAVQFINSSIKAVSSERAGFVFVCMGTLTQASHTWFIALEFSSFTGVLAYVQAVVMSLFLSGGLLFYIVRTGNASTESDKRKYRRIANFFMVFEIFINLFYWLQKIVFLPWIHGGPEEVMWYRLIIAVPFAVLIPVILKTYGGEIRLDAIYVPEPDRLKRLEEELHDFKTAKKVMKISNINHEKQEYEIIFKP